MSFKKEYLKWLRSELGTLVPDGYNLKIVEEIGAGAVKSDKFDIVCYVKFGTASKQNNTTDRINQPVIFNIISEAEGFGVAESIFYMFFMSFSKQHTTIKINDVNHAMWHFYTSPTIQSGYIQIGEYHRTNLIMSGVLSYAKGKIIGVKYYLDNVLLDVISPQAVYTAQDETIQYVGENVGEANALAAVNSYGFAMLLDNSVVAGKLRDASILGTPYIGTLKIVYSDKTYTMKVKVSTVTNVNDNNTGDNVLTLGFVPVKEE